MTLYIDDVSLEFGLRYISVVKHLPSMLEDLSLISSTTENKGKKK